MAGFPTLKGSYRRASVIDLYLRDKFH